MHIEYVDINKACIVKIQDANIVINKGSLEQNLKALSLYRQALFNEVFTRLGLKLIKEAQNLEKELNFKKCLQARKDFVKNCKDRFNFEISFSDQKLCTFLSRIM
ncbi:hypothetical protein [Bartonella vinsonii]|uniref:Uncharacterized protein n=1 Tax=Bartonella vinsonii subsp. berkhoffii str. Tweed TaxID=1094502 RepID=N6UKN9_BARVB|nr:hypothetical protein [Bartonella vinsonii]ENN92969.1 hypothetical protein BVtw_16190 [Bartonella vinsonii subsp. berkhoffii str. Tweed]